MTTWYERAEREIEDDLEKGLIDEKEYQRQMRELMQELRESAEDRFGPTMDY